MPSGNQYFFGEPDLDGWKVVGGETLKTLWDKTNLVQEAYDIMAKGGVWRLAAFEPPPSSPIDSRTMPIRNDAVIHTAIYQAVQVDPKHLDVYGSWEGDENWYKVGGIVWRD